MASPRWSENVLIIVLILKWVFWSPEEGPTHFHRMYVLTADEFCTPDINISLSFFFFFPPISDVMQSMRSAWTWFTPGSRFGRRSPTLPAPASSTSSAPTSGWRPSPSRMSTPPWCSSSCTRCATWWRPTLARSARRTSRTTLCSSTSCWTVGCVQGGPAVPTCPPAYLSLTPVSLFVHAEILDFGYPQNSETGALKTFITQQGIKGQVSVTGRLCGGEIV